MFLPDPGFYPSRIPDLGFRISDPKTATEVRGEKKIVAEEKNFGQISKDFRTFYPKSC